MYTGGADLLRVVSSHRVEVTNRTTEAANRLIAAINDPHCSASKVDKREKEYTHSKAETERLGTTFAGLYAFLCAVKTRVDTEFDDKPFQKALVCVMLCRP